MCLSSHGDASAFRCGSVALVGRPNVGKSSLMNRLIKHKVSIVSAKAQTTKDRINGILTHQDAQYIFVDTPGLNHSYHQYNVKQSTYRQMNKVAVSALADADVIVHMVDSIKWTKADDYVIDLLQQHKRRIPVLLVLNKIDKLRQKIDLLPLIAQLQHANAWQEIIPVSVLAEDNINQLLTLIKGYLPQQPPVYEDEMITDKSMRFMAAEMIREQMMRQLNQELPYGVSIVIERFNEDWQLQINATIFVERKGQKAIVIGKEGQTIKRIGTSARLSMEKNFAKKTHLKLWVKVRHGCLRT